MRINTNMNAMTALNQMSKNTALAGTSMNKISSGERINKSGDDAAGMAISEKMRGQIRGLDQASKNAQDGVSVVQTAEGAMEEIGNITQRMRELTVQASNETNGVEDRQKIATELKQLHSEVDRIAESTQFNGKNLLASTGESTKEVNKGSVIASASKTHDVTIESGFNDFALDGKDISISGDAATGFKVNIGGTEFDGVLTKSTELVVDDGNGNKLKISGAAIAVTSADKIGKLNVTTTRVTEDAFKVKDKFITESSISGLNADKFKNATVELTRGSGADKFVLRILGEDGSVLANAAEATITSNKLDFTLKDGAGSTVDLGGSFKLTVDDANFKSQFADQGDRIIVDLKGNNNDLSINLQIGANTGHSEALEVKIANMTTDALGLDKTDIEALENTDLAVGTESAKALIDKLDSAVEIINTSRAGLGAMQNRLESAQSNLTTSSENLTAAESRIRDVDVAKEMMNLSKLNLLAQASQAMATQAKSQPEGVMQLLR